jgi:hypothetical protein
MEPEKSERRGHAYVVSSRVARGNREPRLARGVRLYTISVQVEPVGTGTVTLDPVKSGLCEKQCCHGNGFAGPGHGVCRLGGVLSGTQNPATLRVGGNVTVIARFATGTGGGGGGTEPPPPSGALPTKGMVVGFFAQWTVYRRGYLPKHVASSGAVQQLNVMNYAFAAPDANLKCASLDAFADYNKRYDASESADGVADTVSQPLKGNFNQILKLKKLNPALRVLISLGGWTESYRFSDAALPANREAFVTSCIDMFIKGNVAAGISAAGVFDGIDVDWEYPGSCGATCAFRTEDKQNFVALLAEFRRQLELLGQAKGRQYLLTIAAPAGREHYSKMDLPGIAPSVDWINRHDVRLPRRLGSGRPDESQFRIVSELVREAGRRPGRQGDQGLRRWNRQSCEDRVGHAVLRSWLAYLSRRRWLLPDRDGRAARYLRKGRRGLRRAGGKQRIAILERENRHPLDLRRQHVLEFR